MCSLYDITSWKIWAWFIDFVISNNWTDLKSHFQSPHYEPSFTFPAYLNDDTHSNNSGTTTRPLTQLPYHFLNCHLSISGLFLFTHSGFHSLALWPLTYSPWTHTSFSLCDKTWTLLKHRSLELSLMQLKVTGEK